MEDAIYIDQESNRPAPNFVLGAVLSFDCFAKGSPVVVAVQAQGCGPAGGGQFTEMSADPGRGSRVKHPCQLEVVRDSTQSARNVGTRWFHAPYTSWSYKETCGLRELSEDLAFVLALALSHGASELAAKHLD
ncbi:MAG: hypothetical protein AAB225_12695 [Acidobacteriota bacterium]